MCFQISDHMAVTIKCPQTFGHVFYIHTNRPGFYWHGIWDEVTIGVQLLKNRIANDLDCHMQVSSGLFLTVKKKQPGQKNWFYSRHHVLWSFLCQINVTHYHRINKLVDRVRKEVTPNPVAAQCLGPIAAQTFIKVSENHILSKCILLRNIWPVAVLHSGNTICLFRTRHVCSVSFYCCISHRRL